MPNKNKKGKGVPQKKPEEDYKEILGKKLGIPNLRIIWPRGAQHAKIDLQPGTYIIVINILKGCNIFGFCIRSNAGRS